VRGDEQLLADLLTRVSERREAINLAVEKGSL
jgi:hypothetical protein